VGVKEHNRLENQHERLISELENQEKLKDRILLERMIFDVDSKISELAQKIDTTRIKMPDSKNNEKLIKEIIRKIVLNPSSSLRLEEEEIVFEIIDATKCNKEKAEGIFREMEDIGLGVNRDQNDRDEETYNLVSFAKLRGYLSDKEFDMANKRLEKHDH
jgi:hypothetical protein